MAEEQAPAVDNNIGDGAELSGLFLYPAFYGYKSTISDSTGYKSTKIGFHMLANRFFGGAEKSIVK